jgi:hypothetical protein
MASAMIDLASNVSSQGGTVISVALSLPSIITVSGSPVTSTGTLTGTLATQAKNLVWAGPTTGANAAPTFRSLISADTAGYISTVRTAYTPALGGSPTNVLLNSAFYWRVGPNIHIEGQLNFNGTSAGSGDLTIALPAPAAVQLLIDTAQISGGTDTSNQGTTKLGDAEFFIQGAGWKFAYPQYNSTSTVYFAENTQHIGAGDFANGDSFKYYITAPIVGW